MSVTKLPSGRWRAQVYDPETGKNLSVAAILDAATLRALDARNGTFRTKTQAKTAREHARARLRTRRATRVTVREFRERWITDPLFARPKESTNIHNAERTKAFAERYGDLPLADIGDDVVAEWLAGGQRNGTVPALRAMFNDAASAKAGRLVTVNPFAGLGIGKGTGNKHRQPPAEDDMERLVQIARDLTPPSFADYLEFGCVTGMRPGELDAMKPTWVDWDNDEINVLEQWNAKARTFTTPKYGPYTIALVARAREILLRTRQHSNGIYVFTTLRGTHYTPSSRTHHWNRVRAAAGLGNTTLYLATRHYFGWYAINVLELDSAIVAEQLGHKDGGKLVEQLYGHPDKRRRRRKIRQAHDRAQRGHLRAIEGDAA